MRKRKSGGREHNGTALRLWKRPSKLHADLASQPRRLHTHSGALGHRCGGRLLRRHDALGARRGRALRQQGRKQGNHALDPVDVAVVAAAVAHGIHVGKVDAADVDRRRRPVALVHEEQRARVEAVEALAQEPLANVRETRKKARNDVAAHAHAVREVLHEPVADALDRERVAVLAAVAAVLAAHHVKHVHAREAEAQLHLGRVLGQLVGDLLRRSVLAVRAPAHLDIEHTRARKAARNVLEANVLGHGTVRGREKADAVEAREELAQRRQLFGLGREHLLIELALLCAATLALQRLEHESVGDEQALPLALLGLVPADLVQAPAKRTLLKTHSRSCVPHRTNSCKQDPRDQSVQAPVCQNVRSRFSRRPSLSPSTRTRRPPPEAPPRSMSHQCPRHDMAVPRLAAPCTLR
eukprot:Opistho-1_new@20735